MIEMKVGTIRVELPSNTPVVLLREVAGDQRTLPIFIGTPEATAIAYALQGVSTPRPMTHDLLVDVIAALGATVSRIVVSDQRDGTFFAEIHVQRDGELHVISARPSDAVALALRTGASVWCDEEVLDAEGVVLEDDESTDEDVAPEQLVEEFKAFIDDISPEDFGSV
jgi:bifunctional DNase/RNase